MLVGTLADARLYRDDIGQIETATPLSGCINCHTALHCNLSPHERDIEGHKG